MQVLICLHVPFAYAKFKMQKLTFYLSFTCKCKIQNQKQKNINVTFSSLLTCKWKMAKTQMLLFLHLGLANAKSIIQNEKMQMFFFILNLQQVGKGSVHMLDSKQQCYQPLSQVQNVQMLKCSKWSNVYNVQNDIKLSHMINIGNTFL